MTNKKIKCAGCGELTNENSLQYSEILDDSVCEGCLQSDREHASTLVRFAPGEKEVAISFGDYHAEEKTWGEEAPDWFWKYFDGRKWVSTGGCRGYYQTNFKNGFVKFATGWVTGWIDKTTEHKEVACDLSDFIDNNTPPVPVYWLFEQTSNVFSTASELFLDEKDLPEFVEWLEDNGFEVEKVQRSFN